LPGAVTHACSFGATLRNYSHDLRQNDWTFLADLYPVDPIAPQVASDFAASYPTGIVEGVTKGDAVGDFVHTLAPSDPFAPAYPYGPQLALFIQLSGPDIGSDSFILS
jgi:hypothetical protein